MPADSRPVDEPSRILADLASLNLDPNHISILCPRREFDWDDFYRQGTPPWDTGLVEPDLIRIIKDGLVKPCSTLEIGCGSCVDAIFLSQNKFEITALDSSPMAIDRAFTRVRRSGCQVRVVLGDIYKFVTRTTPYEFIVDIGFYHFARRKQLTQYLDVLWKLTTPGSLYFTLAGSDEEEMDPDRDDPHVLPTVSKAQIMNELGRIFEPVDVREGTIYSRLRTEPYKAWACLFRRPEWD